MTKKEDLGPDLTKEQFDAKTKKAEEDAKAKLQKEKEEFEKNASEFIKKVAALRDELGVEYMAHLQSGYSEIKAVLTIVKCEPKPEAKKEPEKE